MKCGDYDARVIKKFTAKGRDVLKIIHVYLYKLYNIYSI